MSKRNILILSDLEGVIGIYDLNDSEYCKNMYEKELTIIFDTILLREQSNIYFCNMHDNGGMNLNLKHLYPQINFIDNFLSIDFSIRYDCSMFFGFHSMGGTDGILSHSFRDDIMEVNIGNKIVGELQIYINWLSYYKIPVILVSCDDVAMEEIKKVNCIKNISKYKENRNESLEYLYNRLKENILLSLELPLKNTEYDDSNISIKFINDDFLKYFESINYDLKENYICYYDTLEFIDDMINLSNILNEASQKEYLLISSFVKNLRMNYSNFSVKEINDDDFTIFINKDIRSISEFERNYILDKLDKSKKHIINNYSENTIV